VPDPIFADPRLASIYDELDPDRLDLDHYQAIVAEFGARRLLDVGCGTGELACRLARLGFEVTGVDPAPASLDVARTKPGAECVTWVDGDATSIAPNASFDMAVMTGNAVQAIVDETDWLATLGSIHAALRPGGRFVFETRDPANRAWESEGWANEHAHQFTNTPLGRVEHWGELTEVAPPLISFRWHFVFESGDRVESDSRLRFRERHEVGSALAAAGFTIEEIRGAPDRPNAEFVFIARR